MTAWIALAGMVVFALARMLGLGNQLGRFFALESLTLWLLLPAWVVLAVAALRRRWVQVGVAGLLVLCHLVWVAPDVRWWPREHRSGTGPTIRVVSSNTYQGNDHVAEAAAQLASLRPDVLVVLELTPAMVEALEATKGLDALRYRITDPHEGGDAFGSLLWSRYPLSHQGSQDLVGFPMLSAVAELPNGEVTVHAVHTLQPLAGLGVLREQLDELDYRAAHVVGPAVFAGDFNATRQHHGFRALLQHGLHDAHLQRGRGLARSWPRMLRVPPFALLDHVLVSKDVVVRDVDEATVPGSDHRAVVAQLRLSGR